MRKIWKLKIIAILLLFSIINQNGLHLYAKEKDYREVLYMAGFDKTLVQSLDESIMKEIAHEIETRSDDIAVVTDRCTYDMLDELDLAVNMTEKELISECNLSRNEAKEIKNSIKNMKEMNDEELKAKYNLSSSDLMVLEDTLEPDKNYKKQKKCDLMLSSTIGTSQLTFTQTVTNNSTKKKPIYNVRLLFNWNKCYNPWAFTDKIACAWGGKLVYDSQKHLTRLGYYNDMIGAFGMYKWSKYKGAKTLSCDTAQKNMIFSAPQNHSGSLSNISYLKSGTISFTIDNTKFVNSKANICSVYCHRTLNVFSGNISFKGPTITVGGAYDKTDMAKTTKTIKQ